MAEWMLVAVFHDKIEVHFGTEVEVDDIEHDLSKMYGAQETYKLATADIGDVRLPIAITGDHLFYVRAVSTMSRGGGVRRPRSPTRSGA